MNKASAGVDDAAKTVEATIKIAEKMVDTLDTTKEFFKNLFTDPENKKKKKELEARVEEQTKKIEELAIKLEKLDETQSEAISRFVNISKKVHETMGPLMIAFSYDPTSETLKRAIQNLTKIKSITES
ncbi:unnamed protein product [Oikopleura dioica]|uniref:Uncharacterized protein n=1 Tax=Oikopleura dioica TaxID=34765 RepID=E4XL58_OIKDI|nr:unnamed protein product [Oikopleura dioica]